MLTGFVNLISKPGFQNLIQNTTAQVSIETGLKATGRPIFTLADRHADAQTKKYAAVKELLYQLLCLGIYLAIIPFAFKKTGFAAFKKICEIANKDKNFLKAVSSAKNKPPIENCSIKMFKNEKGLLALYKLGHMEKAERLDPNNKMASKLMKSLENNLDSSKESEEILKNIKELERDDPYFRRFFIGKGGIEMSSIAGSVIGLTILAPEISHLILHPIMKAFNMDAASKQTNSQVESSNKSLDKTA